MADKKFSQFTSGGNLIQGDTVVGLRGGVNTKFNMYFPTNAPVANPAALNVVPTATLANGTGCYVQSLNKIFFLNKSDTQTPDNIDIIATDTTGNWISGRDRVFSVASEAAMLALDSIEGDIAVRTDVSETYINNGGQSGTIADWTLILSQGTTEPIESVVLISTSPYNITVNDLGKELVNISGADLVINLPLMSSLPSNFAFYVKSSIANIITFVPTGPDGFEGFSSYDLINNGGVLVFPDGFASWRTANTISFSIAQKVLTSPDLPFTLTGKQNNTIISATDSIGGNPVINVPDGGTTFVETRTHFWVNNPSTTDTITVNCTGSATINGATSLSVLPTQTVHLYYLTDTQIILLDDFNEPSEPIEDVILANTTYNITATDLGKMIVNIDTGKINVNLPLMSTLPENFAFYLKSSAFNTIKIIPTSTDTIEEETSFLLLSNAGAMVVADNNGMWRCSDTIKYSLGATSAPFGSYTLVSADNGKIVKVTDPISGTPVLNIPEVGTNGIYEGMHFWVKNESTTDVLNVVCAGSTTIDGEATIPVFPLESYHLFCLNSSTIYVISRSSPFHPYSVVSYSTYTVQTTDNNRTIIFSNSGTTTVTLPQFTTEPLWESFSFTAISIGGVDSVVNFVTEGSDTLYGIGKIIYSQVANIKVIVEGTPSSWIIDIEEPSGAISIPDGANYTITNPVSKFYYYDGTTEITVHLPNFTLSDSLFRGKSIWIQNSSSVNMTIQSFSGSNIIHNIPGGSTIFIECVTGTGQLRYQLIEDYRRTYVGVKNDGVEALSKGIVVRPTGEDSANNYVLVGRLTNPAVHIPVGIITEPSLTSSEITYALLKRGHYTFDLGSMGLTVGTAIYVNTSGALTTTASALQAGVIVATTVAPTEYVLYVDFNNTGGNLKTTNNLSDVANVNTSRNNLGVGINQDVNFGRIRTIDSGGAATPELSGDFHSGIIVRNDGTTYTRSGAFSGMFVSPSPLLSGKDAFRCGTAESSQWDSLGDYSVAFGLDNECSGGFSNCLSGYSNVISATTIVAPNSILNGVSCSITGTGGGNVILTGSTDTITSCGNSVILTGGNPQHTLNGCLNTIVGGSGNITATHDNCIILQATNLTTNLPSVADNQIILSGKDGITLITTTTTVGVSNSGGDVLLDLENNSNTGSSSATCRVRVEGSSAADARYQAAVMGVQTWTFGLDNSSSDRFAISPGANLGSGDALLISTAGEMNLPNQPQFLARNSTTRTNVTGTGTVYTVIFNTIIRDQSGDYNSTTGVYTAPITGNYLLGSSVYTSGAILATDYEIMLTTSNRTYRAYLSKTASASGIQSIDISTIADMDAADTASISIDVTGEASDIIDVNATATNTYFYGQLIS